MRISASNQKDTDRLLLASALQYAGRGWRVFPLVPRGKKPLTKTGFKEATTNDQRIITWWERWPSANIGLATGDPFDVIDIDGDEGRDNFKRLHRGYRHRGPVVETGRGYHLYFQACGGGNSSNRVPKVDYRGDGGYVVAPPSVHESGRLYIWMEERGPELPLPELPVWLRDFSKPKYTGPPINYSPTALGGPVELAIHFKLQVRWGNPPKTHCPLGTHTDTDPSLALYKNGAYCFGCNTNLSPDDLLRVLQHGRG